ncbi:hypothetical protein [Sulfurimonas sp.]|uniref:DNA polymerase III subunit beta family protein n=1 Tax=Sulfurimonas sp. TaxID=2022749 RepID=UPI0025F5656B|nr:hypothetical protein [Sulfurimonas sp.]MBW6487508.1 hypothetical protein [Sulfurimonas sp.]
MKTITVNTNGLLNAVAVANNFMPANGDFVGKLVLVGNSGKLEVKSSDYERAIIFKEIDFVSSDLTDADFAPMSIDGKKLLTTLRAAKTDEAMIELHAEHIIVKSGRSKIKIETLANTQNIEIATGNGSSFNLGSKIGQFEQILHSVDTNNPKFELNGVLVQVNNGVFNIVGTDTRRLAAITSETDIENTSIIVPKSAISNIVKLFAGFDVSAEIDDSILTVYTANVSFQTRLINGKFPEWQRIMPQSFSQTITMGREKLSELVKEASLFDQQIKITIKDSTILLEDFEGATKVEDAFSDENADIMFAVNAKSILDFLGSFDDDNVQIGFNGANLPVMLIASPSYREVVMPIIMADTKEEEVIEDAA